MKLEKLFGSKTKVDIIKYLLFKRQGVSMRALETELSRTFPAIKKQIDSLGEAEVITIEKDSLKRSISIKEDFYVNIKNIFLYCLKSDLKKLFLSKPSLIHTYFEWKLLGIPLDMDLVIIHKPCEKEDLTKIKEQISEVFSNYYIDHVTTVFMSADEFEKRYRLADKFVLTIMRTTGDQKLKGQI